MVRYQIGGVFERWSRSAITRIEDKIQVGAKDSNTECRNIKRMKGSNKRKE